MVSCIIASGGPGSAAAATTPAEVDIVTTGGDRTAAAAAAAVRRRRLGTRSCQRHIIRRWPCGKVAAADEPIPGPKNSRAGVKKKNNLRFCRSGNATGGTRKSNRVRRASSFRRIDPWKNDQ